VDAHGYRVDAPVWGEDHPRVASHSDVDRNRAKLQREAYRTGDGLPTLEEAAKARKHHAQAYAGVVDAMADVAAAQVPTYLPRKVVPLPLPERRVEAQRLPVVAACQAIKARIGALYTPQIWADIAAEFGDAGVPEDRIGAICERYTAAAAAAAADDQAGDAQAAGGVL
jgi:hypothetical protein